jgi:hypothetical protein
MANVSSTTITVSAIFMTIKRPEKIQGAFIGDCIASIAGKEFTDGSVTPKENDWIIDEASVQWIIKGWWKDPFSAAYAFLVRKR